MAEMVVIIVGAGPSGLATSVCLTNLSIPNIVLEREDCYASLWKKRTYDRLNIHLAKEFCSLPFMPHSPTTPTFMSKKQFVQYLDNYASHFSIKPRCCRSVISAFYDEVENKWRIEAKNILSGDIEIYLAKFLVVATGENDEGFIPKILGLDTFKGDILHSSEYRKGLQYRDKNVLVVGCGNSGMEIAYDLSNFGVHTSIIVRSPFHVLSKELVRLGMWLLNYLPVFAVDTFITFLAKFKYGNLSKYGIHRPLEGPFYIKATTGRSPVIDVGTIEKTKGGEIKVMPAISCINENKVKFENGVEGEFDVIVFATGYQSSANKWLKDYKYVLNNDGMPKGSFPTHWKGEKNLYCAGFSRRGLSGVSMDAKAIASDIKMVLSGSKEKLN